MNSKSILQLKHLPLLLTVALAASSASAWAQSDGINASGTLTDVPGSGGLFNYTLIIDNSSSSTSSIGTVWYGWIPGQFYLPSQPSSVGTPASWTAAEPSSGGRYSIQLVAGSGAAILPGSSRTFTFTSADSPATLAGASPAFPGTPIGTTFAYVGGPLSDSGDKFVVTSIVPEPSAAALIGLGALGLAALGWRRRQAA